MAIWYIDHENGSSSNNGTSWAQAWKWIDDASTANGVNAGDEIRIAKSPDPVSLGNATWTNDSYIVTLATAQNKHVTVCDTAWTTAQGANCACTAPTDTQRREGSASAYFNVAAGATTGLLAYFPLGSAMDFSAYQRLSFWFRCSVALAAGDIAIKLCSDTAGATPVDEFVIPENLSAAATNNWTPYSLTRTGGGNLGASIQSVAIYMVVDKGAFNCALDNIIAALLNGLSLTTLISKNSSAQGGDEPWYPIRWISGTGADECKGVCLDSHAATYTTSSFCRYFGTTETVTTYLRQVQSLKTTSTTTAPSQAISFTASFSTETTFSGGWNKDTGLQDGETFAGTFNRYGYAVGIATKSGLRFSRYNPVSSYSGFNFSMASLCSVSAQSITGCNYAISPNYGAVIGNSFTITNICAGNIGFYGNTYFAGQNFVNITRITGMIGTGYSVCFNTWARIGEISCCGDGAASLSAGILKLKGTTFRQNTRDVYLHYTDALLWDCVLEDTPSYYSSGTVIRSVARLQSFNHNAITGNHKIWEYFGNIQAQTTVRHTESGLAWQLNPTDSAECNATSPLWLRVAQVAVNANALVTCKLWLRRTHADITGSLVVRGGQIAGVTNDVKVDMTAAADTWEEVTLTFTPTAAGIVEIEAWAYGGNSYSVYVDDFTVSQA